MMFDLSGKVSLVTGGNGGLGLAMAKGLIKAAMALHDKVMPPTIKVKQPIDEMAAESSPFYVNTQKRPWLSHPLPNSSRTQ